jgi:RES domain-containing protein
MLTGYRLVRRVRARDAFGGEGSRLFGGRWTPKGSPAVYCSQHLSLCVLELRVNQDQFLAREGYRYFTVTFPPALMESLSLKDAPRGWDRPRISSIRLTAAQRFGKKGLKKKRSAVLRVPSAVLPQEYNYILNPLHSDFASIKIGTAMPIRLDSRLWQKIRESVLEIFESLLCKSIFAAVLLVFLSCI